MVLLAIAFKTAKNNGAVLVRNGLRPSRYLCYQSDWPYGSDESGCWFPTDRVLAKRPLNGADVPRGYGSKKGGIVADES